MRQATQKIEIRCPLCRSSDHRRLFDRAGHVHVACRGCGLVFVNPQPVDDAGVNARLFGQDHPVWGQVSGNLRALTPAQLKDTMEAMERDVPRRHAAELAFMERFRRRGTLLDVGCANGKFLLAARARRWQVVGVEVAPENAEVGRELFQLDIRRGTLDSVELPARGFDAVRANQVLEHLQDPARFLRQVARVVRPGGCLVVATVNYRSITRLVLGSRWSYLGNDRNGHLCFFDPRTLARFLEEAGFRVLRLETVGARFRNPGEGRGRLLKLVEKTAGVLVRPVHLGGRIKAFAERVE